MIEVVSPQVGLWEGLSVARSVLSGNLSQGRQVEEFERQFSKLHSGYSAVAVSSGTAALYSALMALDLKNGDEVIIPALTFSATANAVILAGAKPVFVDIDEDEWTIDHELVRDAVTNRTKGIIPVHLFGQMARMVELKRIASDYGLWVLEDCAQAQGASLHGVPAGTLGDFAAFSFYPTKAMTTGEGGMVISRDSEFLEKVRWFRNQGMATRYDYKLVGHNLRMSEMQAALGLVQIQRVWKFHRRRASNAALLTEMLSKHVVTPVVQKESSHVFTVYSVLAGANREALADYIWKHHQVRTAVYYPTPLSRAAIYRRCSAVRGDSVAMKISRQILALPVHAGLSRKKILTVAKAVEGFYKLVER